MQTPRRSHAGERFLVIQLRVVDLDAVVVAVGHVKIVLLVGRDGGMLN